MKGSVFPILLFLLVGSVAVCFIIGKLRAKPGPNAYRAHIAVEPVDTLWRGRTIYNILTDTNTGKLILYGRELVVNTSHYLGPKGTVAQITNGMNCQNCHLAAGTLPFANNFGKVFSTYPQFKTRNNSVQTIYGRVNDCLERSLNGRALDSSSHEMKAIFAYITWLGGDIPKGVKPGGTSIMQLPYPDRAADPAEGSKVYTVRCGSCHGTQGGGQRNVAGTGYTYPPLWGDNSYNDGAGLYRLGTFAGFVRNNMPLGADYHSTVLTDKEAWDVAAFVNSRPRPHKDQSKTGKIFPKNRSTFPSGPMPILFRCGNTSLVPLLLLYKIKKNTHHEQSIPVFTKYAVGDICSACAIHGQGVR